MTRTGNLPPSRSSSVSVSSTHHPSTLPPPIFCSVTAPRCGATFSLKIIGLGFDSQWLPKFFPSVCLYSDLPPVAYQQFLLPVVVIRIFTKVVMCLPMLGDRCLGGLITPTFPFIIG